MTFERCVGGGLPGDAKAQAVTAVLGDIGELRETTGETRRRGTRHCVQRKARGQFKYVLKSDWEIHFIKQ